MPTPVYNRVLTADIAGNDVFSDPVILKGVFNLSLSGTWAGTVTTQRRFSGTSIWLDTDTFTSNIEETGEEPENGVEYRFGFKSGDYTSGVVVGRLSQ